MTAAPRFTAPPPDRTPRPKRPKPPPCRVGSLSWLVTEGAEVREPSAEELAAAAAVLRAESEARLRVYLRRLEMPAWAEESIVTGLNRSGGAYRPIEATRALQQALDSGARVVVLHGPNRTGKSEAACRAMARLSRRKLPIANPARPDHPDIVWDWLPSLFVRAVDLARTARFPGNDLTPWLAAPVLVLDDLLEEEEGHHDTLAAVMARRDDFDPGTHITIATTNHGESCLDLYGPRMISRWREAGLRWETVTERAIP